MNKRIGLAGAVLALGVAAATVGVSAAQGSTGPTSATTLHCTNDLSARTNGRWSLDKFAREEGDSNTDIIGLTFICGQGFSVKFSEYLNDGALHDPMPKGIRLWFLPAGGGVGPA